MGAIVPARARCRFRGKGLQEDLPEIQRALAASLNQLLSDDLGHRVLDFDTSAALEAAALAATRERAGRPVDLRDTQIAGIAIARKASIATGNTRHFEDVKVPILNPWGSGQGHA